MSDTDNLPPGAVDARFTLAAERTMLSWLRTALGLMAAGVAVLHVMGEFASPVQQSVLGISLIALGGLTIVVGWWRWHRVSKALSEGRPMPGPTAVWALGAALLVLAIAFAFIR